MKPFQQMPSYSKWKSESSAVFALRSSDKLLKQIDGLVRLYHQKPESQLEISYQLYRATSYWMKHVGGKVKGSERRFEAIENLHQFIEAEFRRIFDVDPQDMDQLLTLVFGKPVHVAYDDGEVFNEGRTVAYLVDEGLRRNHKLVFRKGLAYRRGKEGLLLYDTTDEVGKDGPGEAIFVMDRDGKVYTGSYAKSEFHHSSFLAGGWSMSAGVMKITRGQIESVCPDSGHYQPGKQQMLNLVERLKTYNVNLQKLTVKLFSYETDGPYKGQPKMKAGNYVWDSSRGDVFLSRR